MNNTTIVMLNPEDQILGFSYSFSKALIDHLYELYGESKLYENKKDSKEMVPTSLVKNICHYLQQQLPYTLWSKILDGGKFYKEISNEVFDEFLKKQTLKSNLEGKKEIALVLQNAYDFISSFEERKLSGTKKTSVPGIDLNQNLVNFIETNFDKSAVAGGVKIRGYQSIINWAKKKEGEPTLGELLNTKNPISRKEGHIWRNVGQKSFDHIKSEFERLGIETKNYAFFQ